MKGFSLLEALIAVAIVGVLAVVMLGSFSALRENQILNNTAEEVISLVDEARSKTLSARDSSQYGVHLEAARAVLFKGATFSEPSSENIEIPLSSFVEISNISLNGGGSDIIFSKLTGKTDEYGTIVIRIKNNASKFKTIRIRGTGIVGIE